MGPQFRRQGTGCCAAVWHELQVTEVTEGKSAPCRKRITAMISIAHKSIQSILWPVMPEQPCTHSESRLRSGKAEIGLRTKIPSNRVQLQAAYIRIALHAVSYEILGHATKSNRFSNA